MNTTIVWFRQDLRLEDNPALAAAAERGAVVPVFIWDPPPDWPPGAATRVWLHRSLERLGASLEHLGSRLLLASEDSEAALRRIADATGADAIYWNRRYEPADRARDGAIKQSLEADFEVASFNGRLLVEPFRIETKGGGPYRVYTPFWRRLRELIEPPTVTLAPTTLKAPASWPPSAGLEALDLEPQIDWAGGIRAAWEPGEVGARAALERFLDGSIKAYGEARDFPADPGTSRLSPHLHFGEIGPRQVWAEVLARHGDDPGGRPPEAVEPWVKQLVWREFAHHLLYHFPDTTDSSLRPEFEELAWVENPEAIAAWQRGETGYPIVDAGMRELWQTGWMHNRVRMITASFLCKHIGAHWLHGARWFWDTLVDADLANNTLGWQWVAGSGADAAPYFRIFNPLTQAKRFDPEGRYVKRWIPELEALPAKVVQMPWASSDPAALDYPPPLLDLDSGRRAALDRYEAIRRS